MCILPPSPRLQVTFMDLPTEIRALIFAQLLTKPSPIIIWSGSYEQVASDTQGPHLARSYLRYDREAMTSSRQDLTVSLLRVNDTIFLESARILYGSNTFAFQGEHEWVEIISWLTGIGSNARQLLRHLNIYVDQLSMVWQNNDGSRRSLQGERAPPRNASLVHKTYPVLEGEVEDIPTALEAFIALLGRTTLEAPLRVTLDLDPNRIPGPIVLVRPLDSWERVHYPPLVHFEEHGIHWGIFRYFSMDMPNLVEKWRVDYAGCEDRGHRRSSPIDILWNVQTENVRLEEKRVMMAEKGWNIVEEEELLDVTCLSASCDSYDPKYNGDDPRPRFHVVRFLLRRTPLFGPAVASDPSPYHIPRTQY
jgi:hypothetical protein